jgi:hypothetical protein
MVRLRAGPRIFYNFHNVQSDLGLTQSSNKRTLWTISSSLNHSGVTALWSLPSAEIKNGRDTSNPVYAFMDWYLVITVILHSYVICFFIIRNIMTDE